MCLNVHHHRRTRKTQHVSILLTWRSPYCQEDRAVQFFLTWTFGWHGVGSVESSHYTGSRWKVHLSLHWNAVVSWNWEKFQFLRPEALFQVRTDPLFHVLPKELDQPTRQHLSTFWVFPTVLDKFWRGMFNMLHFYINPSCFLFHY